MGLLWAVFVGMAQSPAPPGSNMGGFTMRESRHGNCWWKTSQRAYVLSFARRSNYFSTAFQVFLVVIRFRFDCVLISKSAKDALQTKGKAKVRGLEDLRESTFAPLEQLLKRNPCGFEAQKKSNNMDFVPSADFG